MTGERTLSERELFAAAIKLPATERASYLDEACGGDPQLRQEIESLIEAHDQASHFMQAPALQPIRTDATVDSSITDHPGTTIGPYKLLQQIGEGGMGLVFMAEQTEPIQRPVALKIIKPGMDTRQVIARFEAERQALAMMDHPNIAKVLDAGTTETGCPYFVMELVKGVRITKYCDEKQLSLRGRVELLKPVCEAVQHAHQKGIIHRDLKPTNVLVAEYDNRAVTKVIDFGVAKAIERRLTERTMFTEFGQVIGTIEYMSPEQAKFNQLDIDTRSDVYSLGVMLYELLTGSTPFERDYLRGAAFDEVLRIIREEEPPKPSTRLSTIDSLPSIAANRGLEPKKLTDQVSGELDWIVMTCLAKDRNARYAAPSDLAADLEHWLCDEPLSIRAPDPAYMLSIWLKRNLGASGWTVALGLIWGTIAGVVGWMVMVHDPGLPIVLRRATYFFSLGLGAFGGIVTVWLVRPKNITAEIVAGLVSGGLAAVVCYTISWGWIAVTLVGLPYGIWLGMISAVAFMGSMCVVGILAAGMLLRRHGQVRKILLPYLELIVPIILSLALVGSILFQLLIGRGDNWPAYVAVAVLLAVASFCVLVRSHWIIRAALHIAWMVAACAFATHYFH